MAAPLTATDYANLPTPVARLLAHGARSTQLKKRHDYFFTAWEVSLKIVVASDPPTDPAALAALASASLGHWHDAFRRVQGKSSTSELVQLCRFFREQLNEKDSRSGRSVSIAEILQYLPTYRNRMAHAGPRVDRFYEQGADVLGRALVAAWREAVFLPSSASLVYVESVEQHDDGKPRARVLRLEGVLAQPDGESVEVPEWVRRKRVYLRNDGAYAPLHPWVLFENRVPHDRTLLFNGSDRGLQYLDCDTGDWVSGDALKAEGLDARDPTRATPLPSQPSSPGLQGARVAAVLPLSTTPARTSRWTWIAGVAVVSVGALAFVLFRVRNAMPKEEAALRALGAQLRSQEPAVARGTVRAACSALPLTAVDHAVDRALLLPEQGKSVDMFLNRAPAGKALVRISSPECVAVGTPTREGNRVWFRIGRDPGLTVAQRADGDEHLGYVGADALVPLAGASDLAACKSAAAGGVYGRADSLCRSAALSAVPADAAVAAATVGRVSIRLGRPLEALTWLVAALELDDGTQRADIARDIELACRAAHPLDAGALDGRRFMILSWPWDDRRVSFFSENPKTSPGAVSIAVDSGSCVLVGELPKTEASTPVDLWINGQRRTGYVHRDMLAPR